MKELIVTGVLIVAGVLAAVFLGDYIIDTVRGLVGRIDLGGF